MQGRRRGLITPLAHRAAGSATADTTLEEYVKLPASLRTIDQKEVNMITIYSEVGDRTYDGKNGFGTIIEAKRNAHDANHFIFRIRWDDERRDDSFRSRWC